MIRARSVSSLESVRATRIGMPPARATLIAVSSPMPEEAPVMTTVRPSIPLRNERYRSGRASRNCDQNDHRTGA